MNPRQKEFIRLFKSAGYAKSNYDLFRDFLTLAFCALAKPTCVLTGQDARAEALEARYMRVVKSYDEAALPLIRETMPNLMALTQLGLTEYGCDFLGEIYGDLEINNKEMGQFFTPYALCTLTAQMQTMELILALKAGKRKYFTVDEPACGAGAMLLALADAVENQAGIDVSKAVWFRATDLSEMAFMMAYVQLSLRGMAGLVIRGNTLTLETFESYYTMAGIKFLAINGNPHGAAQARKRKRPDFDKAEK